MKSEPAGNEKNTMLLSILRKEVKPALGCTGPTSVSFAASAARQAVGGRPTSVKIFVDRDTYKNSVAVGIPGTSQKGLDIAAALGAINGDARFGLEVLKNITPEDEDLAIPFSKNFTEIEIKWDYDAVGLFIEAFVETDQGTGHAVVVKTHTNLILQEANGKVIYQAESQEPELALDHSQEPIRKFSVKDFYTFSRQVPLEEIAFIDDALEMNQKLGTAGMKKNIGASFGLAFNKLAESSVVTRAKALTAAASDARMAGENLPAMSCASSGNVGIAASLPLLVLSDELQQEREDLLRAVTLSFLLTIYLKSHIGRLSALCACAIASSIGVTAGAVCLLGGDYNQIEMAIQNVVGSICGIICDGAKLGCALKLSMTAGVALESAYLAKDGVALPARDGLVFDSADETIAAVGKIAINGMVDTDKVVCRLIIDREKG